MKKKLLSIASLGVLATIVLSSYQNGTHGTLGNQTNSTGSATGCFNCHGNQNNATTAAVLLMDGTTPVTTYVPGQTYTVVLAGSNTGTGHPKFGFQLTCANSGGTSVGTLSANGVSGVSARANNTLLEHNTPLAGTPNSGNMVYAAQFQWTAPAAGTGTVKFYTVINGVNGNGSNDAGDQWNFGTSANITEATTSIRNTEQIKGVQLFPNPSNGAVTVQIENTTPGKYRFELMDMTGRVLQTQQTMFGNGTNQCKVDASALSTGIYLMKVDNGTQETIMKFHKL